MSTSIKLGIAACIVTLVTAYMAYVGMASSWKYYLTVDECLIDAPVLVNQRIRVNGKIASGTLSLADSNQRTTFSLEGSDRALSVSCRGLMPDNLAEDMDVVVEGHLDESGVLRGDKVLTRCASKYSTATATPKTMLEETTREGPRR